MTASITPQQEQAAHALLTEILDDMLFASRAAAALAAAASIPDGPEPCQICGAFSDTLLCPDCEANA
jgi:hypothetical protein